MPLCVHTPVEMRLDFLPTKSESSFERLGIPSVETRMAQERLSSELHLSPPLRSLSQDSSVEASPPELASLNLNRAETQLNDYHVPSVAGMSEKDRAIYAEMLLERALQWEPLVQARSTKRYSPYKCPAAMPPHITFKKPAFHLD